MIETDRHAALLLAILPLVALAQPVPARAQLISPGKLTSAHRNLEGVRGCTRCHELGRPGISDAKCLDCHVALRRRIAEGRGTHARTARQGCAACHKEHFGRDFAIVRFEPEGFDHRETGVRLEGAHREVACRDCHAPDRIVDPEVRRLKGAAGALERTWLGVDARCAGCHRGDDPHDGQFTGRGCEECHGQTSWEEAERFSHASARYRLEGAHARVACEGCHVEASGSGVVRWTGLPFGSCAACHGDPHGGAMGSGCESCHSVRGWDRIDRTRFEGRFDHDRTGFSLTGPHADLDCARCHSAAPSEAVRIVYLERGGSYPRPRADRCDACHVDAHEGAFRAPAGAPDCEACHRAEAWTPSLWDVARHAAATEYPLEGAHAAVPCAGCHATPDGGRRWAIDGTRCEACHADPHGGQFGERGCDACHGVEGFRPARIDHRATRFPLDGAHAGLECAACHLEEPAPDGGTLVRWRPIEHGCADCHGGEG